MLLLTIKSAEAHIMLATKERSVILSLPVQRVQEGGSWDIHQGRVLATSTILFFTTTAKWYHCAFFIWRGPAGKGVIYHSELKTDDLHFDFAFDRFTILVIHCSQARCAS